MAKVHRRGLGGFTLMEMMIVLIILTVVIAIVIPAVAGVRLRARLVGTRQLHNSLETASTSYEMSERRLPGFFSAKDMGNTMNETRGFTGMENVIIELTQAVVPNSTPLGDRDGDGIVDVLEVGPLDPPATARIDLRRIGSTVQNRNAVSKAYWTPDGDRNFQAQIGQVANRDHLTIPDVIDYFGNPVLAWPIDDGVAANVVFAAQNASQRARFYWATNAGMLKSTALGRSQADELNESMLSLGNGTAHVAETMAALLGHPSYPVTPAVTPAAPASSRGRLVFHSPGPNGVYLGSKERGGKIAGGFTNGVKYQSGTDALNDFDDIVTFVGN